MSETCQRCSIETDVLYPSSEDTLRVCRSCYTKENPSGNDIEDKWKVFTGPPQDRMIGGDRRGSEVVTK